MRLEASALKILFNITLLEELTSTSSMYKPYAGKMIKWVLKYMFIHVVLSVVLSKYMYFQRIFHFERGIFFLGMLRYLVK